MIVQTPAIVVSSLKYGDKSIIVKLFTREEGLKAFIVKNAFSSKNRQSSFLLPLSFVEVIYDSKNKKQLNYLKESRPLIHYKSIHSNPYKKTIILFVSEVLNTLLSEEEKDLSLYNFLENSFLSFDGKQTGFADFHLWFLLCLTQFLGFYPNRTSSEKNYFDLENGIFTNEISSASMIEKSDLALFEQLLDFDFNQSENNLFNREQRNILLKIIMHYYERHIAGFRQPKSLEILTQVFE